MDGEVKEQLAVIRDWQHAHGLSDEAKFQEMNVKLDSILEVMSAFKLGGRGVMWIVGFIIAVGTIIVLGLQIFHK